MEQDVSTASSVSSDNGIVATISHWLLLGGDRRVVGGLVIAVAAGVLAGLIAAGVLDVGPAGYAATLFGSGLTSGILTLITIALSINQLILSRVFGSPNNLSDRLDGSRELRHHVESIAGESSSPTDPAAFLSLVAVTLRDRASALLDVTDDGDTTHEELTAAVRDLVDYGDDMEARLEKETAIIDVLDVVIGTEYAQNMRAIRHLRREYAESLPESAQDELEAIDELLEAVAIARQFFKTIALQQDFAYLSRLLSYSGVVALVATITLTLVYQQNGVTLPPSLLPVAVIVGVSVILVPLAMFVSYILRAATIANRTVSVGPFIPPEGR
jgi:hypothetical protein